MADPATVPQFELPALPTMPSPSQGTSAEVGKNLDLMKQIVTHPAFPAVLAVFIGHNVIDILKSRRDAKGKPALHPAVVRGLAFLVTQGVFVALWSLTLWFNKGHWGPFDFMYGLLGSGGAIAWHHWSPWRDREQQNRDEASVTPPPAP